MQTQDNILQWTSVAIILWVRQIVTDSKKKNPHPTLKLSRLYVPQICSNFKQFCGCLVKYTNSRIILCPTQVDHKGKQNFLLLRFTKVLQINRMRTFIFFSFGVKEDPHEKILANNCRSEVRSLEYWQLVKNIYSNDLWRFLY